jgi:hypothetical protein
MTHMRKTGWLLPLALCAVSLPAHAQFTPIARPDAAYLGSTTLIPITAADFDIVSSLSDGTLGVSFSSDLAAATVPTTWSSWGSPPDTETTTPRVLWTQGEDTLTLTFDTPASIFGLEAEPNTIGPASLTATFLNGSAAVGAITLDVDGAAGAKLFAASIDDPFTGVVLSAPDTFQDGFAIAQLRYGKVVPEPGTVTLLVSTGVAGLFFRLRRRQARRT